MYFCLYFLPLELLEKEVYGDIGACVGLALILQIFSRINELEFEMGIYFNWWPHFVIEFGIENDCNYVC